VSVRGGIIKRHSRSCRTQKYESEVCDCEPSYQAWIYDSAVGGKVRKNFGYNFGDATAWLDAANRSRDSRSDERDFSSFFWDIEEAIDNEQLEETSRKIYFRILELDSENQALRKEIERQKELRRKRDERRKETRKAKSVQKNPWLTLAKLNKLADDEGATAAERANAKQRASALRGRLISNAA
jgi:hypothetical protein